MKTTKESIYSSALKLWRYISIKRKYQFCFLIFLMFLASFAEIFSLGAILPFLALINNPKSLPQNLFFQKLYNAFGLTSIDNILFFSTLVFVIAVIFSSSIRLFLLWFNTRLSFAIGADLSIRIYRQTLYQKYSFHINHNTSEIIDGVTTKVNSIIYDYILPLCNLIISTTMLTLIFIMLLYVNFYVAIGSFFGFGGMYFLVIKLIRKRVLFNGSLVASESVSVIKSLQEGLGGIRDILISSNQVVYTDIYHAADVKLRRAQGDNLFLGHCPRFGMEGIGIALIALLAYFFSSQTNGLGEMIPILGIFALGAQRLLPLLQQSFNSYSSLLGGSSSLASSFKLLEMPMPKNHTKLDVKPINFNKYIQFKKISFSYKKNNPLILDNINLKIKKGMRVGFIGQSGSGKSTLLDIMMGLLEPTEGALYIDGIKITESNMQAWQMHLSHVPQAIFLSDSSILENIAFGFPKESIDYERVKLAAKKAKISDIIESWPAKYATIVGERGVRLSGGQRQRIGIARALYKQADIIIFDEATNALDCKTENELMKSIYNLNKDLTIFMVAHRVSTLKNCDLIFELKNNKRIKRIK